MNFVFVDSLIWDYDPSTPAQRPLGGSQSALCYLSAELANRGHQVTLCNQSSGARTVRGVRMRPLRQFPQELEGCNAVIVLNGPADISLLLRPHIPAGCPLILWTQHAPDQPAMGMLQRTEVVGAWDLIVCVSQWHRDVMIRHYGLDADKVIVRRNAIAPAFVNLFPDAAAFVRSKSPDPVLAYTSTPFRGLEILLPIFDAIHRHAPAAKLQVYSSMAVYFQSEQTDEHAQLYTRCREAPGIEYLGSQSQSLLAQSLKPAWILSYPNLFAETSCIAVMEAMAAGMYVITSDLGALPETTAGMGLLIPPATFPSDIQQYAEAFAARLMDAIRQINADPEAFWVARWQQVQIVTKQWTWSVRAAEWEELLENLRVRKDIK